MLEPAFQKFYSALLALSRFQKENDFFQNISALDCFLSEYRNVTFVIQKELAHTGKIAIYEELKVKYFGDEISRWLVEKRNETQKQRPFPLEKNVELNVYSREGFFIQNRKFVAENDEPYEVIIDDARNFLFSFQELEVHFSVKYIFREIGKDENILDNLSRGIHNMLLFLQEFYERISEKSTIVDSLTERIMKNPFVHAPVDLLMVDDYVFNSQRQTFEKGKRMYTFALGWKPVPIAKFGEMLKIPKIDTAICVEQELANAFFIFVVMHMGAYKRQGEIAPTFWTIDERGNMDYVMYAASVRTTTYRIAHEISERIMQRRDIKSVFYVSEAYRYNMKDYPSILRIPHAERHKRFQTESGLVYYMFNKNGEKYVLAFAESEPMMPCAIAAKLGRLEQFAGSTTLDSIQLAFKSANEVESISDAGV